ncbi:MAG TPA: matrixin family metalloprotease [Candidatus Thermoplasmatota archaeon]|nr:matrixin family metalloprotease [Candidatus Thermoplasmatota archaeon]
MNTKLIFGAFVAAVFFSIAPATSAIVADLGEFTDVTVRDANGEVILLQTVEPSNPLVLKTQHFLRLGAVQDGTSEARPGGGTADPGTDCESDAYKTAGWFWPGPYSAYSTTVASTVSSALSEWDSNTAKSISGGASSGSRGTAGTYDGVNQLDWVNIGASTTIAVTTTWSYRGSGEAAESDGQYNTYYAWGSGQSNAMDYENIIQHETGHTFGLNHPTSSSTNSCLTMYAYSDYGVTSGRTLGDGDILGIKAVYGS